MRPLFSLLLCFLISFQLTGQDIASLISEVNLDRLTTQVRQFSGEDSTMVGGNRVLILNRQNGTSGNNLAADFLKERLTSMGLDVEDWQYAANGRNIIATQTGSLYPDSIYVVCGHYDSRANYCADDNASGTIAVLEIARILAGHCLEKTMVYALWDEEEIGLRGSRAYADSMNDNGFEIAGVLNMDMIAWDSDNDMQYDIDVRSIHGSNAIAGQLTQLVSDHSLDLVTNIINPGTSASDHSSFWVNGYAAVLLGEAWSTGDFNDFYHTSGDRIAEFNFPYFHEMTKLSLAWAATVAAVIPISNEVTADGPELTAETDSAEYQWVDCNDGFAEIDGQTAQTFTVTEDGSYAVVASIGTCAEMSECEEVLLTGIKDDLSVYGLSVYPNPANDVMRVELDRATPLLSGTILTVTSSSGSEVLQIRIKEHAVDLDLTSLPSGIYHLQVTGPGVHAVQSFAKGY